MNKQQMMEKLRRQVTRMDEEQLRGFLEQGRLFEQCGFTVWKEANEILAAELDIRHKENRD